MTVQTQRLEFATKLTATTVGVVYVIGLFVVNLHLARFGVTGLGLLREHYILAGLWAVIPITTLAIFVGGLVAAAYEGVREDPALRSPVGIRQVDECSPTPAGDTEVDHQRQTMVTKSAKRSRPTVERRQNVVEFAWRVGLAILMSLLGIAGIAVVSGMVAVNVLADAVALSPSALLQSITWPYVRSLILWTTLIVALAAGTWAYARGERWWQRVLSVYFCFALVLAIIGYLGHFTYSTYSTIPRVVGGGKPTVVRLAFADTLTQQALGLPIEDETQGYNLLFATESTYYILPDGSSSALEVPKSLIRAVITTSSGMNGAP